MSLIPRFYDVKSGSIQINETDIRDYTLYSLRQNIAVVFQDNFLFSGTIRENIMLGNENATKEQLQKAIEMAYLEDFIATLKDGLETQIGERGIRLSGGQKQRVAIARAFLKDAPIIILDEATSALDNKAEAIVQKAIDNLMQDKTVFVIAHRLSTIRNANKIVVINQGEIVEEGTHDELLQIENGAYKMLYDMQFKNRRQKRKRMFSIVIPTLQKDTKILKMLLDELSQDQTVGEIILIDNSLQGFEYNSDKLRIIIPNENLFVNPSWNLGVEKAKFDYIGILNDDILLPKNLVSDVYSFYKEKISDLSELIKNQFLDTNLKK